MCRAELWVLTVLRRLVLFLFAIVRLQKRWMQTAATTEAFDRTARSGARPRVEPKLCLEGLGSCFAALPVPFSFADASFADGSPCCGLVPRFGPSNLLGLVVRTRP